MSRLWRNICGSAALLVVLTCACSDDIAPDGDNTWNLTERGDISVQSEPDASDSGDHEPDSTLEPHDATDTGADTDTDVVEEPEIGDEHWDFCGIYDGTESPDGCSGDHFFGSGDCADDGGVIFDGERCREVDDCNCDDGECVAFASLPDCVESCAAAGWCDKLRMPMPSWDFNDRFCPDDSCPWLDVHVCVDSEDNPEQLLEELNDNFTFSCGNSSVDRQWCGMSMEGMCDVDSWCCSSERWSVNDRSEHQDYCALSLAEPVDFLSCPKYLE